MINYIVSQLNETVMSKEKELFLNIDIECTGILTYDDIRKGLINIGNSSEKEIYESIRAMDINDNGTIEYTGF